jgi:uncharacterized membrane protein
MGPERGRRPTETARTEAFSDGVFAIAITVLVLELAIPATRGTFRKELLGEWVSYVAYLVAFATIGVLWLGHHTIFTLIRRSDPGLLWRNLFLLLTASIFPFPTAVIASAYRVGDGPDQVAAVVLYAVAGVLSGLAWLLLFVHLRRHPELLESASDVDLLRLYEPAVSVAGYALAGAIALAWSPPIAIAIFFVFPVLYVTRVRTVSSA